MNKSTAPHVLILSGGTQSKETTMQSTPTLSRNAIKSVRRVREAGMTLVEIMIVIVIMALIGTGVTVALLPNLERASIKTTEDAVQTVRRAMTMYRIDNPRECPDMQDLLDGEYIDSATSTKDAWDMDFELSCDGRDMVVTSAGPDGQFGNDDDI